MCVFSVPALVLVRIHTRTHTHTHNPPLSSGYAMHRSAVGLHWMESGAPHALLVGRPVLALNLLSVFVLFCMLLRHAWQNVRSASLVKFCMGFGMSLWVRPFSVVYPPFWVRFWCYSIAAYSRCGACPWFSAYQVLLVCVPSLIGSHPFLVLPMCFGTLA